MCGEKVGPDARATRTIQNVLIGKGASWRTWEGEVQ